MKNNKLKIGVLMGGPSAERDISLVTGRAVCENLDRKKYDILPIHIDEKGVFFIDNALIRQLNLGFGTGNMSTISQSKQMLDLRPSAQRRGNKLDLIFIALHGIFGEDGAVQGMLECFGIPYTGSNILASALAMNKDKAADVYRAHNLPTPAFVSFTKGEWNTNRVSILSRIKKVVRFPAVLKPTNQGSALGVSIVKNERELVVAIHKTLADFSHLMAQQFITGREATCGVLEKNGAPFALPPTHILPNFNQFYDYASKYQSGGSNHVCPADFPGAINKKIQDLALQAHVSLGCRGMSRTDIFYADDGQLWVIETNTIPGMTPTSLLPEAAAKAGIGFEKMLDLIISASMNKLDTR